MTYNLISLNVVQDRVNFWRHCVSYERLTQKPLFTVGKTTGIQNFYLDATANFHFDTSGNGCASSNCSDS